MGSFNTHKVINADPFLVPAMSNKIAEHFQSQGYEVDVQVSELGTHDISLSKGGVFKAVLGMKTALKVTLKPYAGKVAFDAGIGIFGQQLIPTLVMYFIAWPVLITQLWGMVQQAELDDTALKLAESVISSTPDSRKSVEPTEISVFCPNCGAKHDATVRFCPQCGTRL